MRLTIWFPSSHKWAPSLGICSFSLSCYPTLGTHFSFSLSTQAQKGEDPKVPKLESGRARMQIQQREVRGGSSRPCPIHHRLWTASYRGSPFIRVLSCQHPSSLPELKQGAGSLACQTGGIGTGTHLRAFALAVPTFQSTLFQRVARPPHRLCSAICLNIASSKKPSLMSASKIASHHVIILSCLSFLYITSYAVSNMCVLCRFHLFIGSLPPLAS